MDKQQKAVLSRVSRNTSFIKFLDKINAFGETLGTEMKNIVDDIQERFSSYKENSTLLSRLEQLRLKKIVRERTYPYTTQARKL